MNFKIYKRKTIATLSLALLIIVPLVLASVASASATGSIDVYKRGTTESTWTYMPSDMGTIFQVGVYISGASEVWGWGFDTVTWNPDVVHCTQVKEGDFLIDEENGDYNTLFAVGTIDNDVGIISAGIGDAILGDEDGASTLETGELCYLKFEIVGFGDANIQFSGATLNDGDVTVNAPLVNVTGPFVVPEYLVGALAALGAAFAAFFAFAAFKKSFKFPSFSKHI
ncbi:MAG: hypothetical protein NWF01_08215 [Candidatus Bathyarchaeota archaeon]|nr:hypothetical protein [Candidatus Bathyarchaeota archaeon]